MGIFSRIFGTQKTIDSGFSLVDEAFYTRQEKAEDQVKATNAKIALLKAYDGFKITQRLLAVSINFFLMLVTLILVLAWLYVLFMYWDNSEAYDMLTSGLKDIGLYVADIFGIPFALVNGFYFGSGAVEGVLSKYMNGKIAQVKHA